MNNKKTNPFMLVHNSSAFNANWYFGEKYRTCPFTRTVNFCDRKQVMEFVEELLQNGFKVISKIIEDDVDLTSESVTIENDIGILMEYYTDRHVNLKPLVAKVCDKDEQEPTLIITFTFLEKCEKQVEEYANLLIKNAREKVKKEDEAVIELILRDGTGLYIKECPFAANDISIEENYNEDLIEKTEKLYELFETDRTGLILFNGAPGTGKSTFIKHLIKKYGSDNFVFLTSAMVEMIEDPSFLSFALDNLKNKVLIIEDAEVVLRSRESDGGSSAAISNLLNISDGILGNILQVKIIATYNTERENIDKALVRKGRMLFEHEFTLLSKEKSGKLLDKLGFEGKYEEKEMSLADIYGFGKENFVEKKTKEKKGKMGF